MNNSENIPNDAEPLDEETTQAPAATTVFSDGSTFDYVNGYQNNGAPVATRDREEKPTIAKSHKIFTAVRVAKTLFVLLFLGAFTLLGMEVADHVQQSENSNVLTDGVNASGQVKVVQTEQGDIIVKRPDGGFFKCAVSYASVDGNPVGLVFCSPGGPSTFAIPVPHDPNNIFYVGPTDK